MDTKAMSIQDFVEFNIGTKENLPFNTTVKEFPKGTVLLEPQTYKTHIYYIISGIIEASTTINNDERIFEFLSEGEFAGEFSFYARKKPSLYGYTCITDCKIEIISIEDYSKALDQNSLLIHKLNMYILEYWFLARKRKELSVSFYSTEERYNRLSITRPNLIDQLSVSKIARYLGVHPNSLSRIRKTLQDSK